MTVSTTTRRVSYTGDSATLAFTVPFKFLANTDLAVYLNDVPQASGFTVAGAGSASGGTVTFAAAPAAGVNVTVLGAQLNTQQTIIPPSGPFPAVTVETMADKAMIGVLELQQQLKRSLVGAPSDTDWNALVAAAARVDKLLGFNASTGQPEMSPFTVTQVASVIATIYAAAAGPLDALSFIQSGAGAKSRSAQDKMRERVTPDDFGAVGDGTTDDTAAVQDAVTSLVAAGGTVFFPKRYKITSQITVSSLRPINLIGFVAGQVYDPAQAPSGLVIGANITGSMVRYVAPVGRASHGGGRVSGLNFYDATGVGSAPGIYTCTAALELYDFALSEVDGNTFHWINGSAILGEFVVMSSIRNNRIRYCGAAGKPAVYLPSTSTSFPGQSVDILFNRIEVNSGNSYLKLGANSADCKIAGNGFEADPATAGTNQEFITLDGRSHQVFGNHLNRNTGSQFTLLAQSCSVTGNAFRGGAYATTAFTVSGNRNTITGNNFSSTRTGYEVDITGPENVFSSNAMYSSGAVRIAGVGNMVVGNKLNQCSATTAVLGAGADWWISEAAVTSLSTISTNNLSNNGGAITTTGGIRVRGTAPNVNGNTFNAFAGTGNGAICLRLETTNAVVGGNVEANSTTLMSTSGIGSCELFGNYSASGTTALPLTGSATYDPASLAAGATQQTTVTVTGAVVGDFVMVSFSQANTDIQWSGEVTANNTVTVTQGNRGAGAVDLASGTLKVRVLKR